MEVGKKPLRRKKKKIYSFTSPNKVLAENSRALGPRHTINSKKVSDSPMEKKESTSALTFLPNEVPSSLRECIKGGGTTASWDAPGRRRRL